MPIKSQAQRRKFAELLVKGEISPEVYERWNREAGDAVLPERVRPKSGTASKPRSASKRKAVPKRKRGAKKPAARRGATAKRKAARRPR